MEESLITIVIDGKAHRVKSDDNLLGTCIALGYDLPYFCYHPAMGSVGACRQCAVKKYKDANDTKGRIIMSCMEPVTDGMIISIEDPEAKSFRKSIVESLMLNHPHDCPVCDEGGECHLQDMTVMTGHAYRRNDFRKRTHTNQYLGSFIHHEMNRCIQCYRCVRFYKDYAGGKDFDVFASRDNVFFGRHEDGVLENEFSGNLVEVCPTGVFTDKTSRMHFTRKWDLTNAPSICVHCSVGCNTISSERYGSLRRIMSRYNGAVNGYFLCDRGRFGYEFVNGDNRITEPIVKLSLFAENQKVAEADSTDLLNSIIRKGDKVIGIGSPRASLEANYSLFKRVGRENFYSGVSSREFELTKLALRLLTDGQYRSPSLSEIAKADAVIILGEDITNTAPMIALAVRQASRNAPVREVVAAGIPDWHDNAVRELIQDKRSPVVNAVPFTTKLDDISAFNFKATPDDIAALGFEIADMIHNSSMDERSERKPDSESIYEIPTEESTRHEISTHEEADVSDSGLAKEPLSEEETGVKQPDDEIKKATTYETIKKLASEIVQSLQASENPVVIAGVHIGSDEVMHAAANIATALSVAGKKSGLCMVLPETNSMGLAMMEGKPLDDAISLIEQAKVGKAEGNIQSPDNEGYSVIILENDLYRRGSKEKIDSLMQNSKMVIALDHSHNATTVKAQVVIPVGTFAESEGTLVNNEGRAQRFYKAIPPDNSPPESWRLLSDLTTFDEVVAEMTNEISAFRKIKEYLPEADFRVYNEKISRQTKRYSGRTAMKANVNVHEQKPPQDPDSPLSFTMEGAEDPNPSALVPYYWRPGWNSYQAMNYYLDKPDGSMKGGDPGIRLIEPNTQSEPAYFEPQKGKNTIAEDEWLVVPVHQIFGSEELSSMSEAVAERIQKPFVLLNERDAEILKTESLNLTIGSTSIEVTLRIDPAVPQRTIGLSVLLPGMEYFDLPHAINALLGGMKTKDMDQKG